MEWYHMLLIAVVILTLAMSVYFSYRYRREQEAVQRGLYAARMNIFMGLMLLDIAALQALLFQMSSLRLVLATLFGLIGLFNIFAGRKNLSYYRSIRGKAVSE